MTTSRGARRRSAGGPAHVVDHRQRQDAALVQRRAREDAVIEKYNEALARVSRAEADRDAGLLTLRQQMRHLKEEAAAKIAEAKKDLVEAVTELKEDHTAEEGAPLLDLTVEQFNKLLYSGRSRSGPTQTDTPEPRPAPEGTPPTSPPKPRSPSPSSNGRPSAQIALVLESGRATSPLPTPTSTNSQPPATSASDERGSESPRTNPAKPC
jgi:hypothetical protein